MLSGVKPQECKGFKRFPITLYLYYNYYGKYLKTFLDMSDNFKLVIYEELRALSVKKK